jgi:hypothetical protein
MSSWKSLLEEMKNAVGRRLALVRTDVPVERTASITRVRRMSELGTT